MRLIKLLFAITILSACTTAQKPAYWQTVCKGDAVRYNFGQLHTTSVERMCRADQKIPVIEVPFQLTKKDLSNVFYQGKGMIWVDPDAPDYAARVAGLTPAVFPHSSLSECQRARACPALVAEVLTKN